MSDISLYKNALLGANPTITSDPNDLLRLFRRTYALPIANGTAATAVTESAIDRVHGPGLVRTITLMAPILVTGDNTNNAVVTVAKRTAGGAAVVIAAFTTNVAGGNIAAFVPFEVPSTAFTPANTQLLANDVLTVAIAKGGSGVALSAATSFFTVSVNVEAT